MLTTGMTATIYVSNMDRAVDFYTRALELPLVGRWGDHYAALDLGQGMAIGLHPARAGAGPQPGTSGSIQVGFAVPAPIEAAVTLLQSRGVSFRGPIANDGSVRLAFFGDQDGNDLYLVETTPRQR